MIGVSWIRWRLKNGELSRSHLTTRACRRTLCGRKIPRLKAWIEPGRSGVPHQPGSLCKTCGRVEEGMAAEYGEAAAEVEAGRDKYDD